MQFDAAAHTFRDTVLLEAAAAQLVSPSSSMIVLVRRSDGVLECMHHADLVRPSDRAGILADHGIDLDAPLTSLRFAFATVADGQLAVRGNSEPLKQLLWGTLANYGAVVYELSPTAFEIIFTTCD